MTRNSMVGKWATHAAMVRLVDQLRQSLEENDMLTTAEQIIIDNTLSSFKSTLPQWLREDLRQG